MSAVAEITDRTADLRARRAGGAAAAASEPLKETVRAASSPACPFEARPPTKTASADLDRSAAAGPSPVPETPDRAGPRVSLGGLTPSPEPVVPSSGSPLRPITPSAESPSVDMSPVARLSRRGAQATATEALREAGLGTRAINLLGRVGVRTLEDITLWSRDNLSAIPNAGEKTIGEIEAVLKRHGLALRISNGPPPRPHPNAPSAATQVKSAPSEKAMASQPPNRARDLDIVERRLRGETLSKIADAHGVTRERVRQVLKREGVDGKAAIEARRAHQLREAEARRTEILLAFRRGDPPDRIARELCLTRSAVSALLVEAVTPADRTHRRANRHSEGIGRQFTDEELVAAVREVAERYGRTPTTTEYSSAAAGGMLPSLPLIQNRLGWREAVLRAGLTPRDSKRRDYNVRWTPQACRHALRRLVVETGEVPTVAQYEALAQLDETLPSSATVRNRLGRWSSVAADLARLPTREEAISRVTTQGASEATSDDIWMSYLDESLSHEDAIVLLISGDLVFSPEFGPVPPELQDTVAMLGTQDHESLKRSRKSGSGRSRPKEESFEF